MARWQSSVSIGVSSPGLHSHFPTNIYVLLLIQTMSDSDGSESSAFEIISEGPASTVTKTTLQSEDGEQHQVVAVKSASIRRKFSAEPHDIIKELRILSAVSHANIIHVLGHTVENTTLSFWMPYVPLSLHELLSSPRFSPYTYALGDSVSTDEETQSQFLVISRSILVQICAALAYLHAHDIAHRDIKPRNVLLTTDGCVKLIDFGISYFRSMNNDPKVTRGDLWPESEEKMYFQVSTGPYRAPELLFRPPVYDAHACDLWSLGAMISEFFTPLRLDVDDEDDDDDEEVTKDSKSSGSTAAPFVIPATLSPATLSRATWNRDTVFDSTRGEIGLAWSIFKVCGTPTEDNWPTFNDLPDANKLTFNIVPRVVDLSPLLPNLPPSPDDKTNVLEAINGLLAYPPSARLAVSDVLGLGIMKGTQVVPPGYDAQTNGIQDSTSSCWKGRSLGEWIWTFYY